MWKKLLSSVLAVVLLLGCCTVALAGSAGSGLQVEILETAIDGITIGVNTDGEAALKNGRVVLFLSGRAHPGVCRGETPGGSRHYGFGHLQARDTFLCLGQL